MVLTTTACAADCSSFVTALEITVVVDGDDVFDTCGAPPRVPNSLRHCLSQAAKTDRDPSLAPELQPNGPQDNASRTLRRKHKKERSLCLTYHALAPYIFRP